MFNLPQPLSYPEILDANDYLDDIIGNFYYVIHDYKPGFSVIIKRDGENVGMSFSDWDGNDITIDEYKEFIEQHSLKIVQIMSFGGIEQAQYYFDNKNLLVDVRVAANKFLGPGILRDVFSPNIECQEVFSIDTISEELFNKLLHNLQFDSFVLKSSRFKYTNNGLSPCYFRIQKCREE